MTRGFPGSSVVKSPPGNAGDAGLISGQEEPLEEEMAKSLQYFYLGNAMDRGAWWATVHWVTKSQTQLGN